jgi:hypothetical protein
LERARERQSDDLSEPFDTSTPVGRMLVEMLGVFAEFERETIIDRVINGIAVVVCVPPVRDPRGARMDSLPLVVVAPIPAYSASLGSVRRHVQRPGSIIRLRLDVTRQGRREVISGAR